MSINIDSLVRNICYWHNSSELPDPYKPIFIKNKCKPYGTDYLEYVMRNAFKKC